MKPQTFTYDILRDCALLEKEMTFANLYRLICAHGDLPAAAWLEGDVQKSMTFNELSALSDNYACALSREFGKSGRVCISLDSSKEWFPLFWGLIRSGHDVMAVDASSTDEKMVSLMQQVGCTMAVCGKPRALPEGFKYVLVSEFADVPVVTDYVPVWGHDIALCTSGTTSESRVFVYNERTICYLALFSSKVYKQNHNLIDNECFRTLAFLPFHHILGFAAIFIWSHFLGDTTVYLKDRSPQTIVKTVKECRVSQIVCVPLLANSLCKGLSKKISQQSIVIRGAFSAMVNLSLFLQSFAPKAGLRAAARMFKGIRSQLLGNEIKSIVLGGSHTDPGTLRMMNALGYFTICGYGMTETAINSFETSYRLSNRLKGSIGEPMLHTEFRIREGGLEGELMIRGKSVHDGRFVDGKLLPPDVDEHGWFSTGDIIRIVPPLKQYFIVGRTKEVIINESGENVYPDEMEDAFAGLVGVDQYTVLGLPRAQSNYEDIALVAAVGDNVNKDEFLSDLTSLIRDANNEFPIFKRITKVVVTGERLPVANGFKVKRGELKRLIEEGDISIRELDLNTGSKSTAPSSHPSPNDGAGEAPLKSEIMEKVRSIYADVLSMDVTDISPDANFIDDLGGDSLQVLSIAAKAEDEFAILIPAESYVRCATPRSASDLIFELKYGTSGANTRVERQPIVNFEDTPEFLAFSKRIASLVSDTQDNPYFVPNDSPLLDTSIYKGREMLNFGSYNYVGMSGRKEVNDAAKAAIDKYGTSSSGSRLLAGEKPIHAELEKEIAEWKHAEAALVLVGGHSTNVTVIGNFCGKNDLILYDAIAHNSVEQGCKLSDAVAKSFPHNDIAALENILKTRRKYFEKVLIVIEGVYSMDGDISDVPSFVALKKKYGCFLMVDEAHSACVLGETGGGVDEYFHLNPTDIDLKYGTLSKGLGTCGGYIAGKKSLIEYLKYNLPGFVFSVGLSPALAAGSLEAIRLLRHHPEIMQRLHSNIECFAAEAAKRHLDICLAGKSAILPVMVGRDEDAFALSNELLRRDIIVPPAVYPAVPKNKARLRFDVISEHKPEQIVHALDTLVQAAHDLGIELPRKDDRNTETIE